MGKSNIEWTGYSWNPTWGCTEVSPGCNKCYAKRMTRWDFSKMRLLENKLRDPIKNKTPDFYFVNAFSDLYHEDIPREYLDKIFDVMTEANWHTYQILTKRPVQMRKHLDSLREIPENWWFGVSVENSDYLWRLDELAKTKAWVRFVSLEPLLGRIDQDALEEHGKWLDWVIVGGESDYHYPRKMELEWAREVRKFCYDNRIALFLKQLGGKTKCKCHNSWGCRILDFKVDNQYPDHKVPEKYRQHVLKKEPYTGEVITESTVPAFTKIGLDQWL